MTKADVIVAFCRSQVGEPYDLGDHGPNKWDCSGLTMEAVKLVGLNWPHSSNTQYYANIKPGGDFDAHGPIDTAPAGEMLFLFHYGTRTNGGKGMVHVGIRDGATDSVIQAGGYLGSGVHENPFSKAKKYFSEWCTLRIRNDEGGTNVQTVSKGSKGAAVTELQNALIKLGYLLSVDGDFGAETERVLMAYQTANGLEADGKCGAATWAAINKALGVVETPIEEPLTLEQRVTALEAWRAELTK